MPSVTVAALSLVGFNSISDDPSPEFNALVVKFFSTTLTAVVSARDSIFAGYVSSASESSPGFGLT